MIQSSLWVQRGKSCPVFVFQQTHEAGRAAGPHCDQELEELMVVGRQRLSWLVSFDGLAAFVCGIFGFF